MGCSASRPEKIGGVGGDAEVWKGAPGWRDSNRERREGSRQSIAEVKNRKQMGELSEERR